MEQLVQFSEDVAASDGPNEPAGQSLHADDPATSAYVPLEQGWHVDALLAPVDAEKYPLAHLMQATSMEVLPIVVE
jgi:hypothetical protein